MNQFQIDLGQNSSSRSKNVMRTVCLFRLLNQAGKEVNVETIHKQCKRSTYKMLTRSNHFDPNQSGIGSLWLNNHCLIYTISQFCWVGGG